ncbi:putative peptidoglycan-binding domain-containing protein [Vibrio sp. WXL210]|uniref:putative peptidoglycan-binding domain-containing protein n=1 Tax=Vibrio sp. WXL210 TaxID=3450709 RepID=UPI003EC509D1
MCFFVVLRALFDMGVILIFNVELAFQIFDFRMNAGGNAIKSLQRCLNEVFDKKLVIDGFWGTNTLDAVNSVDSRKLYIKFREYRIACYKHISEARPKNKRFLNGWIKRANSFSYY